MTSRAEPRPHPAWPAAAAALLLAVVWLKNAWVCDDAYIIFRSLDQLFAGNGPVWNPHERVQVFTSPAWYWLLAAGRLMSSHSFPVALAISAGLMVWVARTAWRGLAGGAAFALFAALGLVSNAWFDFTASGLEYPLVYALLAVVWRNAARADEHATTPAVLWLAVGGLALVRLDTLPLVLPVAVAAAWRERGRPGRGRILALATAPLLVWTAVSVVYYGFPVANPIYAKLGADVGRIALLKQGVKYLLSSLRFDAVTLPVIAAAALLAWRRGGPVGRWLGPGLALQTAAVVVVGGDFMQGRFLAPAYMTAALVLAAAWRRNASRLRHAAWPVLVAYAFLYPHTPVNSPLDHATPPMTDADLPWGIADERGEYGAVMSLSRYLALRGSGEFPDHVWARAGRDLAREGRTASVAANVGLLGYHAGTEPIIVDPLALTDPLLARLPATGGWRIGHFRRELPPGYLASLAGDDARLDPGLAGYLRDLRLVVSGDVWSRDRWAALLRVNFSRPPAPATAPRSRPPRR